MNLENLYQSTTIFLLSIVPVKKNNFIKKYPLLFLLNKTPVDIGCILEKEFHYKDSSFYCSYKNYYCCPRKNYTN